MNAERLGNVVIALRDAAKDKWLCGGFTMKRYGHPAPLDENTCGTPACAYGHYAARPDLQDVVRMTEDGDVECTDENLSRFAGTSEVFMAEHFDITLPEVGDLFGPFGCDHAATPDEAADFIEDFINQRSA